MQSPLNNNKPTSDTVTDSDTLFVSPSSSLKPKKHIFLIVSILLLFGVVCIAGFLYSRTSNFIANTTGGRNIGSLLTPTSKSPLIITVTPNPYIPISSNTVNLVPTPTPNNNIMPATLVQSTPVTVAPTPTLAATPAANLPAIIRKLQQGQAFNLMLLGYGGAGHDGAFLTDTILLLHYDPAKKAVVMTNIPRDLYVFIPYGGTKVGFWGKINAAFAYVMESSNPTQAGLSSRYSYNDSYSKIDAAANLAKDVVEQITGTPVDYWTTFNFNGFRNLVNAIGGVDVVVDTTFDDYEYPANDDADIDPSVMHLHFDAGLQHMNGERAIEFARSRKSLQDGSDFGRSKRQMKLIQAIKEKMVQPSIFLKVLDIMDALQNNVRTSFSFEELHALFDYYRSPEGRTATTDLLFVSQILSDGNLLYASTSPSAGYILLPNAGQANYREIQQWVEQGFGNPQVRSENVKVQIHNATGSDRYNDGLSYSLKGLPFQSVGLDWSPTQSVTTITDYSNGKAKYSLQSLQNLFPAATIKKAVKSGAASPDLVVTVGYDYTYKPQQFSQGSSK